jgi:hypothetical protein
MAVSRQRMINASPIPSGGSVIPQALARGGTFLRYRVMGTMFGSSPLVRFPGAGPTAQTLRLIRR